MKMLLLIGSSIFLLTCTYHSNKYSYIKMPDMATCWVVYFDSNKLFSKKLVNVKYFVENINKSQQIKGPIIGSVVKNLYIVNESNADTIKIVVFGHENKLFKLGNSFYESSSSIW